jgi:hypothetical protein
MQDSSRLSNHSLTTKLTDPIYKKLSDDLDALLTEAITHPNHKLSTDSLRSFHAMIETTTGRGFFIKKLNTFRSSYNCQLLGRDNYCNLCEIMRIVLDEAHV